MLLLPDSHLLNYFLHCAKFCFSQESYCFVELFLEGEECSAVAFVSIFCLYIYWNPPTIILVTTFTIELSSARLDTIEQLSTRQDNR